VAATLPLWRLTPKDDAEIIVPQRGLAQLMREAEEQALENERLR